MFCADEITQLTDNFGCIQFERTGLTDCFKQKKQTNEKNKNKISFCLIYEIRKKKADSKSNIASRKKKILDKVCFFGSCGKMSSKTKKTKSAIETEMMFQKTADSESETDDQKSDDFQKKNLVGELMLSKC